MATNPNNAVGTNGAFGGRTSVNAFNDALATYNDRGVLSGWACLANSGMTVSLGGVSGIRDVAVAMDANGNFTTINNISGSPIDVTLPAAPGTNKRIDVVVAYVDNPPQGNATDTDNPGACGIIPVSGTVAANPSMPNETTIRSAITADGASGSSAYYVVLAKITVASGTTDIDNTMIEAGQHAQIQGETVGTGALADGAVTADKIDYATFDQFGTEHTGTNCTFRIFRFGKAAWIVGNTSSYTYSGTEAYVNFTIPAGTVPSGTEILSVIMTTHSPTATDRQWLHGPGPSSFTSAAKTIGITILSDASASKSTKVAFIIPLLLP